MSFDSGSDASDLQHSLVRLFSFSSRCFSGIVHNLLESSPARGFLVCFLICSLVVEALFRCQQVCLCHALISSWSVVLCNTIEQLSALYYTAYFFYILFYIMIVPFSMIMQSLFISET